MPEERERRGVSPRMVAALVLVVIGVVFVFENTTQTKIRFLVPRVTAPLWMALLGAGAIGAAAGALVARHRRD